MRVNWWNLAIIAGASLIFLAFIWGLNHSRPVRGPMEVIRRGAEP